MKKSSFILVIMSLIIIVAVLTNPDQDRHKEVIKDKLLIYLQKSMKQNQTKTKNEWEEAGQALGIMLGGVLVDGLLNNLMSIDNYVLFSTTKITWEGERKIIGIGALGNVFLTRELDEALSKGLLKN
jgi:hypothetical protein